MQCELCKQDNVPLKRCLMHYNPFQGNRYVCKDCVDKESFWKACNFILVSCPDRHKPSYAELVFMSQHNSCLKDPFDRSIVFTDCWVRVVLGHILDAGLDRWNQFKETGDEVWLLPPAQHCNSKMTDSTIWVAQMIWSEPDHKRPHVMIRQKYFKSKATAQAKLDKWIRAKMEDTLDMSDPDSRVTPSRDGLQENPMEWWLTNKDWVLEQVFQGGYVENECSFEVSPNIVRD